MNGDFSRQTFDPTRHYSTVRMQQGRVQLDADWNEQADVGLYRDETEAADVIGRCGAPLDDAAFGIVLDLTTLSADDKAWLDSLTPPTFTLAAGDFVLTPGHYYVDGILCESEHPVPYTLQPDLPGLDPIDVSQAGFTVVYLDVWQRHLTSLDDPRLRETALGGADTATRTRTIWQVRTVFVGTNPTTCVDDPAAYLAAIASGTGLLSARAKREATDPDPCLVPASAGYSGLENQLYRVEIHDGGDAYDLTSAPGDQAVTVAAADQVVYSAGTWTVGQTVEIFRSAAGSDPMEGTLATIVARDTGTKTLTLNTSLPDLSAGDAPRIRPVEATYKWSRDNGSVVTLVTAATGPELVVASLGPDDARGLAPGQWVELIDEVTELDGRPGFLAEIDDLDRASKTVTLRTDPPAFTGQVVKLRRWDGVGSVKTNPPGTAEPFVELEEGVQVSFSDGSYRTGDHWLIPARTATADAQSGTIEWPAENGVPVALPPAGIRHHYCKVAVVESDGTALTVEDCRPLFPPLTQLATLVYVGGDGQEALPGEPLPQLLEAGVFRGRHPVAGVMVRFTTTEAGGKLAADLASVSGGAQTFEKATGPDGIAACAWLPANDLSRLSQQVEARMLDAGGTPFPPQLDYNAQLSIAAQVAYVPGACDDLASATTVQEALDILCNRPSGTCCVVVEPGTLLDEMLQELLKKGERDICLCLKPGEYKIDAVEVSGKDLSTLSIEGCGARAVVVVTDFRLFGLDSVRLQGLDLELVSEAPLLFDGCAEIALEGCRVTRRETPGPACVIGKAARLRIEDCVLDAGAPIEADHAIAPLRKLMELRDDGDFGLAAVELADRLAVDDEARKDLAQSITKARRLRRLGEDEQRAYEALAQRLVDDAVVAASIAAALGRLRDAARFVSVEPALVLLDGGGEAVLEASDVVGALILYGVPATDFPTQDALKSLHNGLGQGLLRGAGSLHLQDVRLARMSVAAEFFELLQERAKKGESVSVHRALHVTDTEVMTSRSVFVAVDATLLGDDFAEQTDHSPGAMITESAIVSSTRSTQNGHLFVVAMGAPGQAANVSIEVVPI